MSRSRLRERYLQDEWPRQMGNLALTLWFPLEVTVTDALIGYYLYHGNAVTYEPTYAFTETYGKAALLVAHLDGHEMSEDGEYGTLAGVTFDWYDEAGLAWGTGLWPASLGDEVVTTLLDRARGIFVHWI